MGWSTSGLRASKGADADIIHSSAAPPANADALAGKHELVVLAEPAAEGLGRPVTAIAQVAPGATIDAHLRDGRLRVEVVSVSAETTLQAAQTQVEEP